MNPPCLVAALAGGTTRDGAPATKSYYLKAGENKKQMHLRSQRTLKPEGRIA